MGSRMKHAEALEKLSKQQRPLALRKLLIRHVKETVPTKRVAVLLSGGVDSHCALFAALLAGKTPHIYSFSLEDRDSRDFRSARQTAMALGLDFTRIDLPLDIDKLKRHVWETFHVLMPEYELSKTLVECTWPMRHAIMAIQERYYITGMGGDVPYCTSRKDKKAYLAGDYLGVLERGFKPKASAVNLQHRWAERFINSTGKKLAAVHVLESPYMFDVFKTMDPYKEGNKPTQKAISRAAFWDYFSNPSIRVYGQQPYQKGDTGIADHFEDLLKSDWAANGKTVKSIYNRVSRKEVPSPLKPELSIFEK